MVIENQTGQMASGLRFDRVPSICNWQLNRIKTLSQQKSNNSYEKNMEAKAMIKSFAKKEALLSRSDGVTMVGHDQAPNKV